MDKTSKPLRIRKETHTTLKQLAKSTGLPLIDLAEEAVRLLFFEVRRQQFEAMTPEEIEEEHAEWEAWDNMPAHSNK